MPSIEQLKGLLASDPKDSFLRYGLAMAYAKERKFGEAMGVFEGLLKDDPDYVAGYFMAGRTLEQKGDVMAAKATYKKGIEVARRVGDGHAAGEIAEALAALE